MGVLNDGARAGVWAEFMDRNEEDTSYLKAELRAAVDAADDWVDSNAASFNSALPTAFRTGASASQKAHLLRFIVERRYIEGA